MLFHSNLKWCSICIISGSRSKWVLKPACTWLISFPKGEPPPSPENHISRNFFDKLCSKEMREEGEQVAGYRESSSKFLALCQNAATLTLVCKTETFDPVTPRFKEKPPLEIRVQSFQISRKLEDKRRSSSQKFMSYWNQYIETKLITYIFLPNTWRVEGGSPTSCHPGLQSPLLNYSPLRI